MSRMSRSRRGYGRRVPAPAVPGPVGDEVDGLLADWLREQPDVDVSPLAVLSRVTRLARHLDRLRTAVAAEHGIEPWEFEVVSALRRAGPAGELSPGSLLRSTLVSSGAMTNRVDRLESAGLVVRRANPADRRGVLVVLTPRGRRLAEACLRDLTAAEERLLAPLSEAERQRLADLLRALLLPLELAPAR
jgi:DNA-binding MarR family transcriptional regulator